MTKPSAMKNYKPGSRHATIYVFIWCILLSCTDRKAQGIVDDAIERHGGTAYESFELEFDFRGVHYTAARNEGIFTYTRQFTDSAGRIKDILNNEGLVRYQNDSIVTLPDERRKAFSNSVNSVIYFALLPYGLNDDAVNKTWIEETAIDGEPYDVLRITFDNHSGGDDHEDVYLYWIHQKQKTMDYLAYSYQTDGGGLRFRKATNPRGVGGIRFQDYVNYRPADEQVPIEELQKLFIAGKLIFLSDIKMENILVREYRRQNKVP